MLGLFLLHRSDEYVVRALTSCADLLFMNLLFIVFVIIITLF